MPRLTHATLALFAQFAGLRWVPSEAVVRAAADAIPPGYRTATAQEALAVYCHAPTSVTVRHVVTRQFWDDSPALDSVERHMRRNLALDASEKHLALIGPLRRTVHWVPRPTHWADPPEGAWRPLADGQDLPAAADLLRITLTCPARPMLTEAPAEDRETELVV